MSLMFTQVDRDMGKLELVQSLQLHEVTEMCVIVD